MSNCIQNHLYIQGPSAIVDEIRTKVLSQRPTFILPPESGDIQADLETNTKTVRCSFETPADPPWEWFKMTVGVYHEQGVRFFLSWYDADNLHRNDFAPGGELVYTRFGEWCTGPLVSSDFSSSDGYRATEGPISLIFNRRTDHGDSLDEVLTESGQIITLDTTGDVISIAGVPFYQVPGDYDPNLPAIDDDGRGHAA